MDLPSNTQSTMDGTDNEWGSPQKYWRRAKAAKNNFKKRKQTAYLSHIMRKTKYQLLLQLIIEGKIMERRGIGRKKMSYNPRHWAGIRAVQGLIHASRNREEMENVVANIR